MNRINVLDVIKQRRKFPVLGLHQDSEVKYARNILDSSENIALLMFPVGVLIGTSRQSQQIRDIFSSNWNIAGIFDIGSMFEPATGIRFSLVFLTRRKTDKVHFGSFLGKTFSSIPKRDYKSGNFGGELPPITPEFDTYLISIESLIVNQNVPEATSSYKFFSVDENAFDKDRLDIDYYNPELVENEDWIRSEKWVSLSSIAEIYLPRSTQKPARNLYSKFFSYPLPREIPVAEKGTNIVLEKGDILIASIGFQKAYLIHENPSKDLRPPPTFFVIRPKSELITSPYLFLYLQSNTARKYAERYKAGTIFQRMNLADLRDFPIVLPDLITQQYSQSIFERMFLARGNDQLDLVNDLLFSKKPVSEIQPLSEFTLEEFETVRLYKKDLISKLLKDDFSEVKRCLSVDAYKSSLILCGSILEAVLLDWFSEVKEHNYFGKEREPILSKLISELGTRLGDAKTQAERINERRNLVHPRKFLNNAEKINRQMCENVISDLRAVLRQRGLNPQ